VATASVPAASSFADVTSMLGAKTTSLVGRRSVPGRGRVRIETGADARLHPRGSAFMRLGRPAGRSRLWRRWGWRRGRRDGMAACRPHNGGWFGDRSRDAGVETTDRRGAGLYGVSFFFPCTLDATVDVWIWYSSYTTVERLSYNDLCASTVSVNHDIMCRSYADRPIRCVECRSYGPFGYFGFSDSDSIFLIAGALDILLSLDEPSSPSFDSPAPVRMNREYAGGWVRYQRWARSPRPPLPSRAPRARNPLLAYSGQPVPWAQVTN
jgi:hypothetical protein